MLNITSLFGCVCQKPPFNFTDFEVNELGKSDIGEVSTQTCNSCGRVWLEYLIEEPHYSRSGRWWRVLLEPQEVNEIDLLNAVRIIESKSKCFVGGSYYSKGIHIVNRPKIA